MLTAISTAGMSLSRSGSPRAGDDVDLLGAVPGGARSNALWRRVAPPAHLPPHLATAYASRDAALAAAAELIAAAQIAAVATAGHVGPATGSPAAAAAATAAALSPYVVSPHGATPAFAASPRRRALGSVPGDDLSPPPCDVPRRRQQQQQQQHQREGEPLAAAEQLFEAWQRERFGGSEAAVSSPSPGRPSSTAASDESRPLPALPHYCGAAAGCSPGDRRLGRSAIGASSSPLAARMIDAAAAAFVGSPRLGPLASPSLMAHVGVGASLPVAGGFGSRR